MTDLERTQVIDTIKRVVTGVGTTAKVLMPQYVAFIALGEAVATLMPTLYLDVVKLLSKDEVTDEEVKELMDKIEKLLNEPEKI